MLEPLVVVLVAILVLGALCRRFGLVEPPILLLGGLAIGLVPHVKEVELAPELILTIVLPALLYWEALTTSLREVRANLRVIVLLAVARAVHDTGCCLGVARVQRHGLADGLHHRSSAGTDRRRRRGRDCLHAAPPLHDDASCGEPDQ